MVYIGTNIIKLVAFYNFNSKKVGQKFAGIKNLRTFATLI